MHDRVIVVTLSASVCLAVIGRSQAWLTFSHLRDMNLKLDYDLCSFNLPLLVMNTNTTFTETSPALNIFSKLSFLINITSELVK